MSQSERIFWINDKLQNKQTVTVASVAAHFGISERQVKRDFAKLRAENKAPLKYDKETRSYVYEGGFDKLKFASQEMMLAYVMLDAVAHSQNFSAVVSKELLEDMSKKVPSEYRAVCERIVYQLPYSQEINADWFYVICQCISNRHCMHISYVNNQGTASERDIEPERLVNYDGLWYIIGFDHKSSSFRTFNVSHISQATETDEPFLDHSKGYPRMLEGFTYRNYDEHLKRYVEGSFGIFKDSTTRLCQLQFTGTAANVVRGQRWHAKQVIKSDDENGLVIQFPFSNSTELLGKILGYGVQARPLGPDDLVEEWKQRIRELSQLL